MFNDFSVLFCVFSYCAIFCLDHFDKWGLKACPNFLCLHCTSFYLILKLNTIQGHGPPVFIVYIFCSQQHMNWCLLTSMRTGVALARYSLLCLRKLPTRWRKCIRYVHQASAIHASVFFPSLSGTVKRTHSQFGTDLHNFPTDPFTIELKFHITNQNIAITF